MKRWLATALALAVTACAGGPARPTLTAAPDPSTALEARIFPPYYGQVPVRLSKPAYVALFEVIPGRGAALLYPRAGSGFQSVREAWVPMLYSASRWLYTPDAPLRRSSLRRSSYMSGWDVYDGYDPYGGYVPRYLFVIASEEPLAVDQFQGDPASIRQYLGTARYASYEPYDVMERLAYALLPFAPEDAWTMDVYVDYGYDWGYGYGPAAGLAMAMTRPVWCADGSMYLARYVMGWGFEGVPCARFSTVPPNYYDPTVPPPVGGDSVVVPPAGEGRDRGARADTGGRRRATPEVRAGDEEAQQRRQRIAQLREDAQRSRFSEQLTGALRRDVRTRQRAEMILGHARPAFTGPEGSAARDVETRGRPGAGPARSRGSSAAERGSGEVRRRAEPAVERGGSSSARGSAPRESAPRESAPRGGSAAPRSRGESGSAGAPTPSRSAGSSAPSSSGSSSSGSGSSGSSSSGSSGGRSRVPPGGA